MCFAPLGLMNILDSAACHLPKNVSLHRRAVGQIGKQLSRRSATCASLSKATGLARCLPCVLGAHFQQAQALWLASPRSPASRPDFLKLFCLVVLAPSFLFGVSQRVCSSFGQWGGKALVVACHWYISSPARNRPRRRVMPGWSLDSLLRLVHHNVERDRAILDEEDDARNRPRRRSHVLDFCYEGTGGGG